MIDRAALLSDLQTLLKRLEADLLERSESTEIPDVGETLRSEYERAKKAERTAQNYEDWRSDAITQAAAAWVLSCVFVRFLEDNRLISAAKISGPTGSGKSSVISRQSRNTDNRQLTTDNLLQQARDEHTLYFQDSERAKLTDREYLLSVFDELAKLPGTKDVFGEPNPIRELPNWLSGDAAGELLRSFQRIDANTGDLIHDFTDPDWDTRFLGDLYQDLSEAARKKYALLQTPEFVEEFILDRTLEPALDEFGLEPGSSQRSAVSGQEDEKADSRSLTADRYFKMIDPACGSGHFLLGAFPRILDRWQKQEPDGKIRELVQKTLACIHGVDVNPFAVAIARFRLMLAALQACGVTKLANAPAFHVNLVCGDSLYHGRQQQQMLGDWTDEAHYFASEDAPILRQILREGTYHCVVANPPYITPKDSAANRAYRQLYPQTCHMKYSLAVPFMERILRLAVRGEHSAVSGQRSAREEKLNADRSRAAGFVGQITANSFMKREFGKKLVEGFLPQVDLTHVIDTSGAYIPGHGTPTVILLGRHRPPVAGTIRAVMGIRGEPSTPDDPARGLVWSAIVEQIDQPGDEPSAVSSQRSAREVRLSADKVNADSCFVSVSDVPRDRFHSHPWSIGGGGAAELKERLENDVPRRLGEITVAIGITAVTGEDELFMQPNSMLQRHCVELTRPLVEGDVVRDWVINEPLSSVWIYNDEFELIPLENLPRTARLWWTYRAAIYWRKRFGTPLVERGLTWYEWQELYKDKLRTPLSIVFAFVATHNHFVLDRGGKVFNRSAPVIKLPPDASEDDHLALLGLLNSSTACFWMKQVFHDKGSTVDSAGARQTTVAFENFREFTGTGLLKFPLPEGRPTELARRLDELARRLQVTAPREVLTQSREGAKHENLGVSAPLRELLSQARARYEHLRGLMIFLQEELDWACYKLYGLIDEDLTYAGDPFPLAFGERSFEILLAQKVARQTVPPTTWFERHGATPLTDPPQHWPDDYRNLYLRRHEIQQSNQNIGLIEQPEYKRRWNTEPWDSQVERALKSWLLDRLESYFDFDGRMKQSSQQSAVSGQPEEKAESRSLIAEGSLTTVAKLADIARQDPQFMEVAEVYRDDAAFDVQRLVEELVKGEHVPLLPVLRYKPAGLRKRDEWERTWELQRREDALSDQLSAVSDQLEVISSQQSAISEDEIEKLNAERRSLKAQLAELSIPVPPKYKSGDFISTGGARYWALRGKLDVPKERWVSFPHCEGPDGTLPIAWAGYDHLQLARAISAYFVDIQERLGGRDDPRLVPLLACIIELLPWLKQWHHDIDPDYNQRMDEVFEGFVTEEAKNLGLTIDEIKAWEPPRNQGRRKRSSPSQ